MSGLTSTLPSAGARATSAWGLEVARSGFQGEAVDTSSVVTLSTAGTSYAGAAPVTFTLATARRIKATVNSRYIIGSSTTGRGLIQPTYVAGNTATLTGATTFGLAAANVNASGTSGYGGATTGITFGTVFLPAGTYTVFATCIRATGGSSSDYMGNFQTIVEDIGAS